MGKIKGIFINFRTKILLSLLGALILWLSFTKSIGFISERCLYPFANKSLQNFAKKTWNADLYINQIKGNFFTSLKLKGVSLTNFKNYPETLSFAVDEVDLTYRPFALVLGKFNADFLNSKIISEGTLLPLEISHHGHITTITFSKKHFNIDAFHGILLKEIPLNGVVNIEGTVLLKDFKINLARIDIRRAKWQIARAQSKVNKVKILISDMNKSPYIEIED